MRIPCVVALTLLTVSTARAQSEEGSLVSAVSIAVSSGAAVLQALPEGSELVIESITALGKASRVVVRASANGASAGFEVSAELVGQLGLAVGKTVTWSTNVAGHTLVASGKVIAFVPNEIGRTLVHHRELPR